MLSLTMIGLAALTILTSAIPHGHSHARFHLAPRADTINWGACGGDSGNTCTPGYCCSKWGYCGKSDQYCGAGCQSEFGSCGAGNGTAPIATAASGVTISTAVSVVATETAFATVTGAGGPIETTSAGDDDDSSSTEASSILANTKVFSHHPWTGQHSWPASSAPTTSAPAAEPTTTSTSAELAPETTTSAEGTTTTSAEVAPASVISSSAPTTQASTTASSSVQAAPTTSSTASVPQETTYAILSSPAAATTLATSYSVVNPEPSSGTWSSAAAPTSTSTSGGSSAGSDSYKMYTGDGSASAGWPTEDSWVDFDSMWTANEPVISSSCTQFGTPNNSDDETAEVKSAIQAVASSAGVDERFILAVVMQESKGCVRAPTTNYGVTNPGLMQSHDGSGSCNNGGVLTPCPSSQITQMITDGTAGTSSGDGLKQGISRSGSDVSKYYKAARIYNSGSIAASGNLQDGIATHCYASDVANRLTGWVKAATGCTLG